MTADNQGMLKRTPFYDNHLAESGQLVDFSGWALPIHYGSQVAEHHQVRRQVGMFDVSHMMVTDCLGEQATAFLRHLLANDVAKLVDGKALYSTLLNVEGGIIDDLIVYRINQNHYRIVSNAGTREKVNPWFEQQKQAFQVNLTRRDDVAMLAIQGPQAIATVCQHIFPEQAEVISNLSYFHFHCFDDYHIARTGYTGEDGVEIILPETEADALWQRCRQADIAPCGLGARDTLRLEAGMNLYGTDMTESNTPLNSGLAWTVAMQDDREFIGRAALAKQKEEGITEKMVGVVLTGRGVMRNQQDIFLANGQTGVITSGGFSPTLEQAIGLARVTTPISSECEVVIRKKRLPAKIGKVSFCSKR